MKDTIINSFDTWTTAQGLKAKGRVKSIDNISLEGIARLRELILDLAVRGRLVPQDLSDEPVELLFKRIQEKMSKREIVLPKISKKNIDFTLPKNWYLCRIGHIFKATQGVQIPMSEQKDAYHAGYIKYLYISDFKGTGTPKYVLDIYPQKKTSYHDLIMINTGATAGEILTGQEGVLSNNLFKIEFPDEIDRNFAIWFFKSPYFHGVVSKTLKGGANPHMGHKRFYEWIFPFPPPAEQHRIVAKVDELMALCDKLEAEQTNNLKTHQQLVKTLLQTLATANDADELQQAWQRMSAHFDTLFCTEDSIDQLKQTILQLAIMGKLVRQNPADEPASELLKKIAKEKAKLVKEGKLKKEKLLPEISKDEKPFELPQGWEWVRLGDFGIVFSGASFKSEDFNEQGGAKVIKITNAGVGTFIETTDYLPSHFIKKYPQYVVLENDLILALTRPFISAGLKISKCPSSYDKSLLNQRVASIRLLQASDYVFLYLKSSYVLNLFIERFGGSGLQPNLKVSDVTNLVLPIPPFTELQKIILKVDELMALCDKLNNSITRAQDIKVSLSKTIVENAVV